MIMNNNLLIIVILIFTTWLNELSYGFPIKNKKLKRFCKKCLSLGILDENRVSEERNSSSVILLSNSLKI